MGSAVLFSLFLAFKFLPKDLVNTVLSVYFVLLGLLALTATLEPLLAPLAPEPATRSHRWLRVRPLPYVLQDGLDVDFSFLELGLAALSALFCVYYWTSRHWLASNALGIAFSVQGIEHLSLGSTSIGVLLLCGLFFYDVFWVFFTPVMVSVARSFDAPIKLLFPRAGELDAEGRPRFSMLGLGDIVIPGVFVALVLRYDAAHGGRPRFFLAAAAGYVAGLAATILAMNLFEAAQPALLYLVPAILTATFGTAFVAGEARALFTWHEQESRAAEEAEGEQQEDGNKPTEEADADARAPKNKDD